MLRIYQERELLIRIRARINQQNSTETEETSDSSTADDSSERVDFVRHHAKKLTSNFAQERVASDPGAKHFIRELRTFLYEEVGGFGNAFHFRERNLPRLDGTVVCLFFKSNCVRVRWINLITPETTLGAPPQGTSDRLCFNARFAERFGCCPCNRILAR